MSEENTVVTYTYRDIVRAMVVFSALALKLGYNAKSKTKGGVSGGKRDTRYPPRGNR